MKYKVFKFIKINIKKYKLLFLLNILTLAIYKVLELIIPNIQSKMINNLTKNMDSKIFITYLVILIIMLLSNVVFKFIENTLASRFMENIGRDIRNQINNKLLNLSRESYENITFGELTSILNKEINIVKEFPLIIFDLIMNIFILISTVLIMLKTNKSIAIILITSIILYIIINNKINKNIKKISDDVLLGNQKTIEFLQENFNNYLISKIFNAKEYSRNRFERMNNIFTSDCKKLEYNYAVNSMLSFITVIIGLIFIWVIGGVLVNKGSMEIGDIWMLTAYQSMLFAPMRYITTFSNKYNMTVSSLNRLNKIEELSDEVNGELKLNAPINNINLDNISFSYDNNLILDGVNINLEKGKVYVLLGKSGSGKSTLIKILLGEYEPNIGGVNIEGINLSKLDKKYYRKEISFISSNSNFYMDSIRNNFNISGYVNLSEVEQLCIDFDIWDEILQDGGLDCDIKNNGSNFSTGQLVRFDFIRNMLKKPSVIIVDEAISTLDKDRKDKVYKFLNLIKVNSIILIVSHSSEDLAIADEVLYLENKKIRVSNCRKNTYIYN